MRVIVLNKALGSKQRDMIRKTAAEVKAEVYFFDSEKDIPENLLDTDVVYGFGVGLAQKSKSLKWLCVPSAGVDFMMRPGAFANENCLFTNSAGAYGVTIAEHIIAVSLMMMRRLTDFYAGSLKGEWGSPLPQKSLKDCKITVLGTGDIGCCFANRVKAFEPKQLIGVCRSGKCDCNAFDKILKVSELDAVLPESELLVMCLPSTPETNGILSRERMELLTDGAYVVNVGRGSAINEDALKEKLDSGKLAGAALDVFINEPLPTDSSLWTTKNLLITPHVAGNLTVEYTMNRNVEMFCEDLINFANGRPLVHLVDRKLGY
ncbi:MAG: D-2-hydroxyacid dehydrogenase [Lachnospiraceae bacterium]|nr:D-2-hydroxyacid dehydrogenase [Lachnospiraceae bacterium]